jgi:hypothetical protein
MSSSMRHLIIGLLLAGLTAAPPARTGRSPSRHELRGSAVAAILQEHGKHQRLMSEGLAKPGQAGPKSETCIGSRTLRNA